MNQLSYTMHLINTSNISIIKQPMAWHVAKRYQMLLLLIYFDNTLLMNKVRRGDWLWCICWAMLSTVRRGERLQKAVWWVGQLDGSWRIFWGSLFRTFIRGLLESLLSDAITSCALFNILFKSWKQKVHFIFLSLSDHLAFCVFNTNNFNLLKRT